MLELKNITKEYKPKKGTSTTALNNTTLTFANKGMVFITGKSGSGKSTLLNVIGGLDKQSSGDIILHNKNFSKFKNSDFDSYRNTYIGFVFQDYNLIEEYNVYKNIDIAFSLQKKKVSTGSINAILDKVGLSGLGSRKINELSGGQKQRVAIARAIAKDSSIILADEPTGNLDTETSMQIFELLKSISNEKLVIVVTHDVESANKYASRIIELQDGNVVSDINNIIIEDQEQNTEFKFQRTKLSFFKSLGLAFSNLKRKKIRMAITILLVTFALSLFGFSYLLTQFNIPYTHAKTIVTTKEDRIEIYKKTGGKTHSIASLIDAYSEIDYNNINNKLSKYNIKPLKTSIVLEDDQTSTISFNNRYQDTIDNYKHYAYNSLYINFDETLFVELPENSNINIIGKMPKEKNEILISKLFADYMILKGLVNVEYDKNNEPVEKIINFSSYEDIISGNKKIDFGSIQLTISGITNDDLSKYEYLKNVLYDDVYVNRDKIYEEFEKKNTIQYIYVNSSLFNELELKPNNFLYSDFYKINILKEEGNIYLKYGVRKLNKEITIYNGTKNIKINKLNDNEIIISDLFIADLDPDFSAKQIEHLQKENEKYKKLEEEREKKLKEQERLLEEDPTLEFKPIPEILRRDYQAIVKDFNNAYLKEKKLIGSTIDLQISDVYLRLGNEKTTTHKDIKIIGYTDYLISGEDGYYSYISDSIIDKWLMPNFNIAYIYFNESRIETLESLFKEIPINSKEYQIKTLYSDSMKTVEKTVNKVSKIANYTTIAFLVFTIIMFMNFIISSINKSKKDIGILKALGTKTKDIFKIYILESTIVAIFSSVLSLVAIILLKDYCNVLISKDLFFTAEVLIFRIEVLYALIASVFIILLISSIIPISKLTKMKPIDIIYNK